ncbi:MAG: radical SAM protein [Bdellovibrionales bacterium]
MFERILVEKSLFDNPQLSKIRKYFPELEVKSIEDYREVFGSYKKPYLHKRDSLNLILAEKKGSLLKEAPDAYGLSGDKHYYFVHAYNCIYECEYCYLQGYFNSPDIVLFLNHEDIREEMQRALDSHPNETVWFHAGEFSDSLALSHLSGELENYWSFFKENPRAKLELRTKSANLRSLIELDPLKNVFVSFSLASEDHSKIYEKKTAPVKTRLKAIAKLHKVGFNIGVHFDPIVFKESFFKDYRALVKDLSLAIPLSELSYMSMGVVRFTKEVFREVQENYPETDMISTDFIKSFDGKVRYPKPLRKKLLNELKSYLLEHGAIESLIYECME